MKKVTKKATEKDTCVKARWELVEYIQYLEQEYKEAIDELVYISVGAILHGHNDWPLDAQLKYRASRFLAGLVFKEKIKKISSLTR